MADEAAAGTSGYPVAKTSIGIGSPGAFASRLSRGQKRAAHDLRQCHVRGVVCREVGAPRPDPLQQRFMAMSPEIESVQALRGHRHTLESHDPRSQVATGVR